VQQTGPINADLMPLWPLGCANSSDRASLRRIVGRAGTKAPSGT